MKCSVSVDHQFTRTRELLNNVLVLKKENVRNSALRLAVELEAFSIACADAISEANLSASSAGHAGRRWQDGRKRVRINKYGVHLFAVKEEGLT